MGVTPWDQEAIWGCGGAFSGPAILPQVRPGRLFAGFRRGESGIDANSGTYREQGKMKGHATLIHHKV